MLAKLPAIGNRRIQNLLNKAPGEFKQLLLKYLEACVNGFTIWEKAPSQNYIRLNCNALVNHIYKNLKPDCKNLASATRKAIEVLTPDQYSLKKDIKFAAVHFAMFLLDQKLITKPTLKKIRDIRFKRVKEPVRNVIKFYEYQAMLESIKKSNRTPYYKEFDLLLVMFLFLTGVRISELANLEIQDLNLKNRTIFIKHSKGGKSRYLGIRDGLLELLTKYINQIRPKVESKKLLITENGNTFKADYAQKRMKKITQEVNLPSGGHQFRAGFASYLHYEKKVSLDELKRVLGHSSVAVTEIYLRSSGQEISERMAGW